MQVSSPGLAEHAVNCLSGVGVDDGDVRRSSCRPAFSFFTPTAVGCCSDIMNAVTG